MFSTKFLRYLRFCIIVCVCGSVLTAIVLLLRVPDIHSVPYLTNNSRANHIPDNLKVRINPKHIVTSLIHHLSPENTSSTGLKLSKLNSSLSKEVILKNLSGNGKNLTKNMLLSRQYIQQIDQADKPSYNIHAFYYPWYGTPENDGQYLHWNHPYIPHWNKKEAQKWPNYIHKPPEDIGSNFYPLLGAYSSRDTEIIDLHMQMMRYAKIGVTAVSWYPPGDADNEGKEPDSLMPLILDAASKYDIKVAVHVEPFKGRNALTMKENIRYLLDRYGSHTAFYRTSFRDKVNVPLIYIYDSYLVDSKDWATIFTTSGTDSIRNTEIDCLFIGLLVEGKHRQHLVESGFDGFYTYFATNQFTYGSTWINWPQLSEFAKSKGMLFIPSVGPGYIDTEVRPWNGVNTRKRLDGKYYNSAFSNAINLGSDMISITSFNEWHEGTQIEPAVQKQIVSRRYEDYGIKGSNFYLDLTKHWVDTMMQKK